MDSNFGQLCRLCLESSGDVVNLFEVFQGSTIASILTKHFWFQIHKNDGMSEWLCEICWIQTKTFHHFYKRIKFRHGNQRQTNDLISTDIIKQEPSDSPKDESWEPDLNIVKCEETELTEAGEVIDYNDDQSEESQNSDTEDEPYNKKSKNNEDNSTTDNETPSLPSPNTEQSSRTVNDEQDAQIRQYFSMKCEICSDVEFETLLHAKQHYRGVHNTKGYLTCCGKKFEYRYNILDHVRFHIDPIAFRCDQCGKSFPDKRALRSHMENHLPRTHKCSSCSSSFAKPAGLKMHVQNVHLAEKFPCSKCNMIFRSNLLLTHHIRDIHTELTFDHVCDICSRGFRKKHLLLNHTAREHFEEHAAAVVPKAQCTICREWFKHERVLQLHLREHHQDTIFEAHTCVICNKVEESNESLAAHLRSAHSSVKP